MDFTRNNYRTFYINYIGGTIRYIVRHMKLYLGKQNSPIKNIYQGQKRPNYYDKMDMNLISINLHFIFF
jgi:hypothetical protein